MQAGKCKYSYAGMAKKGRDDRKSVPKPGGTTWVGGKNDPGHDD